MTGHLFLQYYAQFVGAQLVRQVYVRTEVLQHRINMIFLIVTFFFQLFKFCVGVMQRDKAYVKGIQFAENLELPSNLKYYISIALDTTKMDG